jgi:hypothetical protein
MINVPDFKWPELSEIITEAPPVEEHWTLGAVLGAAAPRMIEVTMAYAKIPNSYTVRTIRNSTFWKPGDWVSFDTMSKTCANPGWDVTMIEFKMELPHLPIPLPLPIP